VVNFFLGLANLSIGNKLLKILVYIFPHSNFKNKILNHLNNNTYISSRHKKDSPLEKKIQFIQYSKCCIH